MCKRKSPKSQIRGCVGHSSKNELDGFNHLMDESFSEPMVLLFSSHSLKLFVKIFHLGLSFVHHIISNFSAVIFINWLISTTHHWLLHAISSIDVGELDLFFIFLVMSSASSNAWLDTEHQWAKKTDENQKNLSNSKLCCVGIKDYWIKCIIIIFIWFIILSIISKWEYSSDH